MIETRQILEEFQLKNVLATSSTGAVFLAEDGDRGEDVVIKLVSCSVPNSEDEIRRLFLAMVAAARSIQIRSVPPISDSGLTPEGDGFVVMDYLDGQRLDEVGEISPAAAVSILIDVLGCIEDLAKVGTAHLNLNANNVFVTDPSAHDRAVVLGFGSSAILLHAGAGVPVPANDPHLAPELVAGNVLPMDQGWRSDLFSLGVIACGLLGAEIEADGYERPRIVLPRSARDALGEAEPLEEMLAQIMEPDPMRRGGSPSEFRDPLIRALPEVAPSGVGSLAAVRPAPKVPFDPNRTDPALSPEPASKEKPAPPAVATDFPTSSAETVVSAARVVAPLSGGEIEPDWPEVLFDDPELPGALADPEDTDVRNPVPEDVWVPLSAKDLPDAPAAVPAAPVSPKPTKRGVSVWELALVSTVVAVLGSILAFTWPRGSDDSELVVESPARTEEIVVHEPLVPPPGDDNLFDDLVAIQHLVDAGELDEARAALDLLDEREGLSFSSDESALYSSLVAAVNQAADRGSAIADLRGGLEHGSIKMLRRGVAGVGELSWVEISEVEGLADDLERGRSTVRLHGDMWEAHREGDHLGAIDRAGRLAKALPGYSGALEIRKQSASDLEARAEGYIAGHEFENAVAVLESLLRVWPDRDGPVIRIAWCREQIAQIQRAETDIARALARGMEGDPEDGLAMLDDLEPERHLQDEYDLARQTLEDRLAGLDAGEPSIEIAPDQILVFKKNQTVTVHLKVTDDYRVERVVVHARNQSDDGYLQIPLELAENGLYNFIITPELHANQNVLFYVVARDHSGHVGRLGAQDAPYKVERKRWFKKSQ